MTDRFVSLMRHGAVLGGERFRGRQDDGLCDLGWAAMAAQVRALRALGPEIERVLSSPARRCAEFGRRLVAESGWPLTLDADLAERGFGDWEGLAADRIAPALLARFWEDPVGYTPPGAEPFGAFRQRVLRGWRDLLAAGDGHTLVLTHGGAIRVILAQALEMGDSSGLAIEVPPACVTRLRVPSPPGRPSLMGHWAPPRGDLA